MSQASFILMKLINVVYFKVYKCQGAWLAQLVEHVTLDLGVVSLSPTLGVEIT